MFWLAIIVFLAEIACFAGGTCVKGLNTDSASTKGTGTESICIRRIYTRVTCSGSVCTGAAYIWGTESAFIRGAGAGDTCISSAFVKYACVGSTYIGTT